MEKSQGNSVKPPTSRTIDGTAVARIVASIATRPVQSMTAARTGPRSDRRPTSARVTTNPYPTTAVTTRRAGEKSARSRHPRRPRRLAQGAPLCAC